MRRRSRLKYIGSGAHLSPSTLGVLGVAMIDEVLALSFGILDLVFGGRELHLEVLWAKKRLHH